MKIVLLISALSILIFFIIPLSSATFYTNFDESYSWSNTDTYENEKNSLKGSFKITIDGWESSYCIYDCYIQVNGAQSDESFIGVEENNVFLFTVSNINMGTNEKYKANLVVECSRRGEGLAKAVCFASKLASEGTDQLPITLDVRTSKDSICDYNNGENCENNKLFGCGCSGNLICNLNSPLKDNKGCTSCGNRIADSSETCSNCEEDVGKCDGLACSGDSECIKNHYCVWNVCSDKPYRLNDGHCDLNKQETCVNSEKDCACKNNMQCNRQIAQCEIFCGNGICEQEEAGKCKADCQWCGDGICNGNDNCKNCDLDCGKCKEENKPSLLGSFLGNNAENQQNTEIEKTDQEVDDFQDSGITGDVTSDESSNKNNSIKMIILVAVIFLTLLVLIYGGKKIWKNSKKENTDVNEPLDKKKRIKELRNNLKKHEKEIKRLTK